MDTLHRPEIFERIIEVDQQARKALVNAIWIPRVATIAYKENQFGWPATVKSGTERPRTGPIDWNAILRYKKKLASELDLDDLPALRQLVTDFTADPEYARRFDPISAGIPGDMGRHLSETWGGHPRIKGDDPGRMRARFRCPEEGVHATRAWSLGAATQGRRRRTVTSNVLRGKFRPW